MGELEPSDRTLRAATAVRRATGLLARRMRRQGCDPALSPGRASLLGHLTRAAGPLTPGELAAADGLQPQSVTRLLADLEGRGWISRRPDARDGRQARIAITVEGRYALAREAEARDLWLARAMTLELSPAERALLRAAADLVTRLCETPAPLTADELPSSAVPILPTHDARRTRECLVPLGFEVLPGSDDGYLMLRRDGLELHYQHVDDVDPFRTAASVFRAGARRRRLPRPGPVVARGRRRRARGRRGAHRRRRPRRRIGAPSPLGRGRLGGPHRVARGQAVAGARASRFFDPTNNLLRIGHPIGLNRELSRRRRTGCVTRNPSVPAARCSAGRVALERLPAVFTSDTWVNACGKLPSMRPDAGSYCSESRPTSLARPASRSNSAARLVGAPEQTEVVGQPERAGEERALARRQPVDAVASSRSGARTRRASAPAATASTVPTTRGSVAGRNPTSGIISSARVEILRAVVLGERVALGVEALLAAPRGGSRRGSARHRSTGPSRPNSSTAFTARSNATHAITFECMKSLPRPAHLPDALVGLLPRRTRGTRARDRCSAHAFGSSAMPACAAAWCSASSTSP